MSADREQAVFLALADPTRRWLLERLAVEGERTATELAQALPMTRQGVAKHLKILAEAELVTVQQVGRDRRYGLTPEPLQETVAWVTAVTAQWDKRLQALYAYLAEAPDLQQE